MRDNHHMRAPPHTKAPPNVVYAQLKFMWASGAKDDSIIFLRHFSESLSKDIQAEEKDNATRSGVSKQRLTEISQLLARCYFKQGQWQWDMVEDWGSVGVHAALLCKTC